MNDIGKPTEGEPIEEEAAPKPADDSMGAGLLRPLEGEFDPNAGIGERDLLNPANLARFKEAASPSNAPTGGHTVPPGPEAAVSPQPAGIPQANAADSIGDRDPGVESLSDSQADSRIDPEAVGAGMPAQADLVATARDDEEEEDNSWAVSLTTRSMDDPLLGCLTILCTLLERPFSSDALTAGLPMVDGQMTPELFIRAAERAGIAARLIRRRINALSRISLPCVLLLNDRRSCVLTDMHKGGVAEIIMPEMGSGSQRVPLSELAKDYAGYALFARPEFQFDSRATDNQVRDPKGWFWGTLFRNWKIYGEVVIAAIMVNCFAIATPLFTMNVYDRVVPNFAEETLWVLATGAGVVFLFDFLLKWLRAMLVDKAGKIADTRIAARLFEQVLGMKMADRPLSAGALASNLREFDSLRDFFTSSTLTILVDLPFIFMFCFIISLVGGKVAIVPLAAIPIVIIVGMLMQIPMRRIMAKTSKEASQKHAILVEAITGIETIKATAAEGRLQRNWENFSSLTAQSGASAQRWSALAMNFSATASQVVNILVVVYGVYLIQAGELSVGGLVAATMLSGRVMGPLASIAGILMRLNQARASLQGLDNLMKTPVERPEGKVFVHRPNFRGHIEFKNVTFSYPNQKTPALNDVSFNIDAGERVGIIGRIGCGKSTLWKLIMGLYEPEEGSIMVDGTDVRQIDPADLRRSVGCVPQDVYLFFGSVKDNIAFSAPYADDAMILRASKLAGVEEFVSKNPAGYDMEVGERGQALSGGQRQSIAVARALLLDPPILIMDEPTSSMDNTSESRFKARMEKVFEHEKTLLLITHRGSMLSLVDRLIVMDGGKIVADGGKEQVIDALTSGRIQTARELA